MKILKKLKTKKGFTLVESMVSIAILSIAMTVFAVFLSTTNKMTMLTIQNERDAQILQEIVATGDISKYEGTKIHVLKDDAVISIVIKDSTQITEDPNIQLKGKYVVVEDTETKNHYVIFLGDK